MLVEYHDTISTRLRAEEDGNKDVVDITNDYRINISKEG
jgi:hypothetical protein